MYDVNNEHMFWELLETYIYDRFSNFIKFWSSERNTKTTLSDLYFTEESDYSEENASENTSGLSLHHSSTIYSLSLNKKKRVVMRAMREKLRKQSFSDILQHSVLKSSQNS